MKELIAKSASSKFKNARKACPGMSDEVYILADYIAKYISNADLNPSGMLMTLVCVQDDLQRGRCGFAGGDKVPEEFISRRDALTAQFCYILQVIDAIFEADFADAVRNECKEAFGWNAPKQVKFQDPETYPPYIKAAIDWWANAVQHPKMDNGDNTMNVFMAMFGGSCLAKEFAEDEMRAFRSTLAKGITDELESRGQSYLSVDYGPSGVLADAGEAANMGAFAFPFKTSMVVTENLVKVASGYGSSYKTIWQA